MSHEQRKSSAEAYIALARAGISRRIATSPDAVNGLYGITVVERAENRPPGEDCHQYTLGQAEPAELYWRLMTTHKEIDILSEERRPDDILIYCDDKGIVHVGRISPDGKNVISKWGPDGHVYKHPPLMVPNEFGNSLSIFRPPTVG